MPTSHDEICSVPYWPRCAETPSKIRASGPAERILCAAACV